MQNLSRNYALFFFSLEIHSSTKSISIRIVPMSQYAWRFFEYWKCVKQNKSRTYTTTTPDCWITAVYVVWCRAACRATTISQTFVYTCCTLWLLGAIVQIGRLCSLCRPRLVLACLFYPYSIRIVYCMKIFAGFAWVDMSQPIPNGYILVSYWTQHQRKMYREMVYIDIVPRVHSIRMSHTHTQQFMWNDVDHNLTTLTASTTFSWCSTFARCAEKGRLF